MANMFRQMLTVAALLAACLVCAPPAARAGERSLIAGFQIGEEVRYTLTVRSEETTSVTGTTGVGAHAASTETVGVLIRCKARTVPMSILEVVYESFKITLDSSTGRADVDLGGPAPDASAPPLARDLYKNLHGIVGATLTLNTAPGSGKITSFRGGEALLNSGGSGILRRYLDKDLFEATFSPIFQLKENSSSPPPGQKWYVQRNIFAYAHPGKTPIWETRVVDGVLADIATIKGSMLANADAATGDKGPAMFKSISGDVVYTWDMVRARLLSVKRNEVINSRFVSDKVLKESDLISRSTLDLVERKPTKPAPPDKSAAPSADGKAAP